MRKRHRPISSTLLAGNHQSQEHQFYSSLEMLDKAAFKKNENETSLVVEIPSCIKGAAPRLTGEVRDHSERITKRQKYEDDLETDDHKIQMRMKQIGYGKNTSGYDNYIAAIPKHKRRGFLVHPRTPDPYEKQSKRAFDGRIKVWRRALHKWDDPQPEAPTSSNINEPSLGMNLDLLPITGHESTANQTDGAMSETSMVDEEDHHQGDEEGDEDVL